MPVASRRSRRARRPVASRGYPPAHRASASAAAAFRDAMAACPGAQSARVALMMLLMTRGDRQEAEALATKVQTAPPDPFDPWWSYWLGDFPALPELLAGLRGAA